MEQHKGFSAKISEPSEDGSISIFHAKFDHKYVEGYQIFCASCNKPCLSFVSYYPCIDGYVVDKIRCHLGCGRRWKLKKKCEEATCH